MVGLFRWRILREVARRPDRNQSNRRANRDRDHAARQVLAEAHAHILALGDDVCRPVVDKVFAELILVPYCV